MENIISSLKSFGLTDYEARAYATLLKLNVCTAEEISEAGSIPLPRVYDTIGGLQKKGFVLVTKTRPKKFKPIPPEKALHNFIDMNRKENEFKIKEMKDRIADSAKLLSTIEMMESREEKHEIWTTEKRENVHSLVEDQVSKAKKEILIFSGDLSWINERISFMKSAINKGVSIKVIMIKPESSKKIASNISKARKIGIKIRNGYNGMMRGHIIDGKLVSVITKSKGTRFSSPHTGTPSSNQEYRYRVIIFDHPVIVNSFIENFNFWWDKLK